MKKHNKWVKGISGVKLITAFVDVKGWFQCKFCMAKSLSVELMIIHVRKHNNYNNSNINKCLERKVPSFSCFILNYEAKVICVSCKKDDTSTYSSLEAQLAHFEWHEIKSLDDGPYFEVSISVRLTPLPRLPPSETDSAAKTKGRINSQSASCKNSSHELSFGHVASDESVEPVESKCPQGASNLDNSSLFLPDLHKISRELRECLYTDEIDDTIHGDLADIQLAGQSGQ